MSSAYASWAPDARGVPRPAVRVRPAEPGDLSALATVMASRGGTPEDHRSTAVHLLSTAPVLLIAEDTSTTPPEVVGWSGATQVPLQPEEPARWLTAGLTVIPEARRAGIGRLLLHAVGDAVALAGAGHFTVSSTRAIEPRWPCMKPAASGFLPRVHASLASSSTVESVSYWPWIALPSGIEYPRLHKNRSSP